MVVNEFYFPISDDGKKTTQYSFLAVRVPSGTEMLRQARTIATKYAKEHGIKYGMRPVDKQVRVVPSIGYTVRRVDI